ncbi:MAG: LamG-like jellyroll fold domain-containing protein [Ignavibacteria bacterium]|nr:LamG-like jellyroll fold domain-containing protein [Ignavibacteria bacterium]
MKKRGIYIFLIITLALFYSNNIAQVANIAHRGGAALAPENTLAAFKNAVALKVEYFELDVYVSADDSLMIMHDGTINRTTTGAGSITALTYAQLRTFDAGVKFSAAFTGEKIPTLHEALMVAKTASYNIGVVIEIKGTTTGIVGKVIKMVQDLQLKNRVIISSFSLAQITESRTIDPTIATQLFGSSNSNAVIDQLAAAGINWLGSSSAPTKAFLDYAHSKNVKFNSWTINSAATMASYIALGVDGITTDNPATMKSVTDTTPPTDVNALDPTVVETKVTLKWNAATDNEGAIIGYNIYRDVNPSPTTLLASVGNVLEYTDDTFTETVKYYYRIKAKNTAGMLSANYSNEISATTLADLTKPKVVYVTSNTEDTKINIDFSERVDQTTAENKANYTVNKSVTISSAKLSLDQKTVQLTTSPLAENSYTVMVKNVKDRAKTPNAMVTSNNIMLHKALSSKTIAYYSCDELKDSVLVDASSKANNGTLKNGPALAEGKISNALKFDGVDDYVQFAASPSFDIGGNAVTVSLWAYLDYLPVDLPGAFGPLFDSDADQYVLYEDKGNNELRFKVATSASAERPGIPAASLVAGQWLHIVGVYDGSNAKIYLNSIMMDNHPLTGTVKPGQIAMLGRSGIASASYFKGKIDNVQIFNTALSQIEVTQLYSSTKLEPLDPAPSYVLLNSVTATNLDVKIQWKAATNYESGLMYEIYRDARNNPTSLIATVPGSVTEYTDKSVEENAMHYYRIRAKNTAGLFSSDYSNELAVIMNKDTWKPNVLNSTSRAEGNKLVIEFNETVDQATAETAANYKLDKAASVLSANLALDQRQVILTTSPLTEATYTLVAKGVKDKAGIPNTVTLDSSKFVHKNLQDKTISYYSLDDIQKDSVVTDFTASANNGILKKGTKLGKGILGNGLEFDGVDDYVQFASSPTFDINAPAVSVSLWAKLAQLPAELSGSFCGLFDSDADQYAIYLDKGNKELRFKVTTTVSAERPGIPEIDLISGQWIHLVGVYDGTAAKIYLNGVLKDSHPLTGNVKPGQVLMLGRNAIVGPVYYKGNLDNIHVFSKALTQDEITDLYQNITNLAIKDPVGVEENLAETIPVSFSLSQNYPNPFNPQTKINYALPKSGVVTIKLYDILGKEVEIIENGFKNAGNYSVSFDAGHLASGVYIYKMVSGDFSASKKLLLLK